MAARTMVMRKKSSPALTAKPKTLSRRALIQPRLHVGPSNDKYEQEADKMADIVTSMKAPSAVSGDGRADGRAGGLRRKKEEGFRGLTARIQRISGLEKNEKLDEEETRAAAQAKFMDGAGVVQRISRVTMQEDPDRIDPKPLFMVQRECEECKKEKLQSKPLQRHGGTKGFDAGDRVEENLNASKSGGRPLPDDVKGDMEGRFGADFSNVRIHTDARAAETAGMINAKAFTQKENIYFNERQYQPGTQSGKHLLAHELTHTIQQGAAGAKPKSG